MTTKFTPIYKCKGSCDLVLAFDAIGRTMSAASLAPGQYHMPDVNVHKLFKYSHCVVLGHNDIAGLYFILTKTRLTKYIQTRLLVRAARQGLDELKFADLQSAEYAKECPRYLAALQRHADQTSISIADETSRTSVAFPPSTASCLVVGTAPALGHGTATVPWV